MITFEKLFQTLEKRHKTAYNLLRDKVIGDGTLARIKRNESITSDTINKLCDYLHCKPMDILTYTPGDKVKDDPGE